MGYNSIPNDINTQYNTETGYGVRYTTNYKGLLTGILTAQLTGNGTISPTYLYSVMYYDKKGQLIQTKSNNHLPGGIEKEYFAYDFTGQPTAKKKVHSATGKATQTEIYSYTYDHAGRLTNSTHNWNGITNTLADNTYDELGRLKTNHKGGSYANSKLKTTYGYNIRSWTTSISSPLYVENLYYNSVTSPGLSPVACYNGNLSGISWQFYDSPDPFGCGQLGYNFFYDNLSRLKDAKFWRCGSDNQTDDRSMYLTYDKHGNIATLERYGNLTATTYGKIDHLRGLVYYGNQLNRVLDYGSKVSYEGSMDFKDHIDMYNEYTYNANGAMTKDLNKGINIIQYNSLNLPMLMDVKSPVAEARNEYTYSATGNKLKVTQKYNPNFSTTPVIGSAINTSLLTMNKTTDYVGNIVYEDGALKRILVDGGYIEWGQRFYYITGHLGNNNLVLHGDGSVKQRNQYYPFGMNFASDAAQGYQPYKYNGKELDKTLGVNLYDYLARWLDPSGRFTTIDPHAEKYYSISPYAAFMNNPINVIDPDGRDAYYLTDDGRMVLALKNDDKYDTLHGKNKDLTSKGDPLKVNDKNLLPQLSGLNGDSKGAMTANGADAFNIFKFAADNSNVEWSLSGFKNEGEMNYYLNTQFSDAQASMGDNYAFKREDMLFNVHSHSRENATKGGSGYSINPDGTLARVSEDGLNAKDFYIERGNKIMPLYVYHRHTKGLYQYTPWNKAARTWRNIQSGKRMKSIINP